MSIAIDKNRCVGCKKCIHICPGRLLYETDDNKAFNKYPKDCWGCAACVKECKYGAIRYYLGADIGGNGGYLYTEDNGDEIDFVIVNGADKKVISVSRKESNKY